MLSNVPHEPVGGEMAPGDGISKLDIVSTATIYKGGEEISLLHGFCFCR